MKKKDVLKKIKLLSYRGLWKEDMDDGCANPLGRMFGFMNVDKLVTWIVVSIIEKEEEMKNNSHWGPALWTLKERITTSGISCFYSWRIHQPDISHLPKAQWNWVWLEEGGFNYWYEYFQRFR